MLAPVMHRHKFMDTLECTRLCAHTGMCLCLCQGLICSFSLALHPYTSQAGDTPAFACKLSSARQPQTCPCKVLQVQGSIRNVPHAWADYGELLLLSMLLSTASIRC